MTDYPVVIFDGVCNLCNGVVNFILQHQRKKQFRFVALQSEAGEKAIQLLQIPPETNSVILYWKKRIYTESEAALEIARLLPAPWKWLVVFTIVPKKVRDKMYRWVARNRYRWFGQKQSCRLPSRREKQFFPEAGELPF